MKGLEKVTREELVENIARYMMIETRGFTVDESSVEWDTSVKDSQISLLIDDIEEMLEYLEVNHGYRFDKKESTPLTFTSIGGAGGSGSYTYSYSWPPSSSFPVEERQGVTSNVRISIGTGNNPSLFDLMEFILLSENLGIDKSQRMSGSINTSIVIAEPKSLRTERDEKGRLHYCIEDHSCKS